jgi:hypothetical protein
MGTCLPGVSRRCVPSFTPARSHAGRASSRATCRQMQIPPAVLNHLIRGYLGTWGLYGLTLADLASGQAPALATDQLPVVRRFYSQMPPRRTRYEELFFDMVAAAEQARRSMKAVEAERPGLADEFEQNRLNRLLGYRGLERAKRQEQAIRREDGRGARGSRDDGRTARKGGPPSGPSRIAWSSHPPSSAWSHASRQED